MDTSSRNVEVICGKCNSKIEIKKWGVFSDWLAPYNKVPFKTRNYPAPSRDINRRCVKCGGSWFKSAYLELEVDSEDKIVYRFHSRWR